MNTDLMYELGLISDKTAAWDDKENLPLLIGVPAVAGLALTGRRIAVNRQIRKAAKALEQANRQADLLQDPLKRSYLSNLVDRTRTVYDDAYNVSRFKAAAELAEKRRSGIVPKPYEYDRWELDPNEDVDTLLRSWRHFTRDPRSYHYSWGDIVDRLKNRYLIDANYNLTTNLSKLKEAYNFNVDRLKKYDSAAAEAVRDISKVRMSYNQALEKDKTYLNRLGELGLATAAGLGAYEGYKAYND